MSGIFPFDNERGDHPVAKHRAQKGFTLIELLIVMAILAMLAALVGPALFERLDKGKQSTALSQISMLEAALDSYRLDVGHYPNSLEALVADSDDEDGWDGPYLNRADEVPLDPWKNEFIYARVGRSYSLLSYGGDGLEGGEGPDADIGK
jgi:general secretion pathway protein G